MLQGTIVGNSLTDSSVLDSLEILRSWSEGGWNLYQVRIDRKCALELAKYLSEGPWYMHFWEPEKDSVLVVFRNKSFDIKLSDKSTWEEVTGYGKSLGIPEEQLDFLIEE